ncbi:hypothetical protein ACHAW5_005795 [Stephanodiscus triporus]|uniref:Uncharacterized protein n=1 Tax=Stephanodiscus triporus TaxID=2934178 RepID=A0ABD3PVZ3_9STRA
MKFATTFIFLAACFDAADNISARLFDRRQVVASVIVVGSDAGWCIDDGKSETDANDCVNFSLNAKKFKDDTVKGKLVDVWVDRSVYRGDIDCLKIIQDGGEKIAIVSGIVTGGPQEGDFFLAAAKINADGKGYYGPWDFTQGEGVDCDDSVFLPNFLAEYDFVEHLKGVVKIQGSTL